MRLDFSTFVSKYPDWETTFNVYTKDSTKYKRIICRWEENCQDKKIMHEYHATINITNGDIFLDCSPRTIFTKHIKLIVARPIHITIKTLWHLSIILPLGREIFDLYKGKSSLKKLVTHTFQSLSDIVRTPLYGLAMTVTHIAGFFLGSFCPNYLYYTRDTAGWLERKLLRKSKVFKFTPWVLSPCFSPCYNLNTLVEDCIISLKENYSIKESDMNKHIYKATIHVANRTIESILRHRPHLKGIPYKSSVAL